MMQGLWFLEQCC